MLNTGKTYRVCYKAMDGHLCAFKFKTDRSFRRYHNSYSMDGIGLGQPFLNDLYEAAQGYMHEGTNMYKHGGFNYYGMTKIECLDTSQAIYFTFC